MNLFIEENTVIKASVIDVSPLVRFQRTRVRYTVYLDYNDKEINGVVFNREYLHSKLKNGVEVIVSGKYNHYRNEIIVNDLIIADKIETDEYIKPVYGLALGIANKEIVSLIKYTHNYALMNNLLKEILPIELTQKYRLISRKDAYLYIHNPPNKEGLRQALRYLKFEELIIFSLSINKSKNTYINNLNLNDRVVDKKLVNEFIASLPYPLTNDQNETINDIIKDLSSNKIMHRLIQGDVGTGKTLVAVISLIASTSQGQGALMPNRYFS